MSALLVHYPNHATPIMANFAIPPMKNVPKHVQPLHALKILSAKMATVKKILAPQSLVKLVKNASMVIAISINAQKQIPVNMVVSVIPNSISAKPTHAQVSNAHLPNKSVRWVNASSPMPVKLIPIAQMMPSASTVLASHHNVPKIKIAHLARSASLENASPIHVQAFNAPQIHSVKSENAYLVVPASFAKKARSVSKANVQATHAKIKNVKPMRSVSMANVSKIHANPIAVREIASVSQVNVSPILVIISNAHKDKNAKMDNALALNLAKLIANVPKMASASMPNANPLDVTKIIAKINNSVSMANVSITHV